MGGGTGSYREVEEADFIVLWGSNARAAHPIFFHHVLKAVNRGARLFVVDPRRTESAQWGERWLGIRVGTDIALSNAVAREILHRGLEHKEFIANATSGFEAFRQHVEAYTPEYAAEICGIEPGLIRELAEAYATATNAQICWTLGITEHHNAVDNVLSLINLGLLTGHVGKWGSGLNPLRGQNNVQGGGDMGALPDRLPGFQHVENDELRARFEKAWGVPVPPKRGLHLTAMFDAMERRELRTLYIIGENPVGSESDEHRTINILKNLDFLVVQDMLLTETAKLADVVFPAAAGWCETEGTVTNSERRVQRVRKALNPPPGVRDDMEILNELAGRMGVDLGIRSAEEAWNELRSLSPMHAGMSYARLDQTEGLQWPCYDETHPGEQYLHSRLWNWPVVGPLAPFSCVHHEGPLEATDAEYPICLTTGRRLDAYNTGVQTGRYASPLKKDEAIEISPADAAALGLSSGERVRVVSRRGTVEAPVRIEPTLRPGLAFLTFHYPEEVRTNLLTVDYTDPKAGTAEFKAAAVRIEKLPQAKEAELTAV